MFGMKFFTGLYLGDFMLCSFCLLLFYPSFSYSSFRNAFHICVPSLLSKSAQLCMCGHWSTAGPQLKPRDKNIIAVSAGRKRIRLLQIGPFPNLCRRKRVKPMQFHTQWWRRISVKELEEKAPVHATNQHSPAWSADRFKKKKKTEGSFSVIHTVFVHICSSLMIFPKCQWHTHKA